MGFDSPARYGKHTSRGVRGSIAMRRRGFESRRDICLQVRGYRPVLAPARVDARRATGMSIGMLSRLGAGVTKFDSWIPDQIDSRQQIGYHVLMLTKQGVHYHLKVGPEFVRLYDEPVLMAGPYVDMIFDDLDKAHDAAMGVIEQLIPDYLDAEDVEESYEFSEQVAIAVKMQDTDGESWSVSELGHEIEFEICSGCRPKGMN